MCVVWEKMERHKASNGGTINLLQQCWHMGASLGLAPILAVHHLLTQGQKLLAWTGRGRTSPLDIILYLLRRRLLPHLVSIICNYILRRTIHPDQEDSVQMSVWIQSSWHILLVLGSER